MTGKFNVPEPQGFRRTSRPFQSFQSFQAAGSSTHTTPDGTSDAGTSDGGSSDAGIRAGRLAQPRRSDDVGHCCAHGSAGRAVWRGGSVNHRTVRLRRRPALRDAAQDGETGPESRSIQPGRAWWQSHFGGAS